ncbi:MAG: TRAP transporter TatT component family protein, partial [Gammaproteobacteria bacterium]|nr:TRAP transporter TatT component family protein [Gammaproteobacteria bacterium]
MLLAGAQAGLLSGCASLAGSAAGNLANELSGAILDQDDPELVRDSLPAYLLLLDALARSPDAGSRVLDAAARLNAAYAVVFLREPERASLTAEKARTYGVRALCAANRKLCGMDALGFEAFEDRMDLVRLRDTGALLGYATGSLAFIRTHSDDWQALADLPRVEAALKRLLALGPGSASDAATVN